MAHTIPLTKGKSAIVDDNDYSLVSGFKWSTAGTKKSNAFYAARRVGTKTIFMHNVIYENNFGPIPEGKICDHKNLNGLDNQKQNLRLSTYSENCANVPKKRKNPTSKYKGVFFEISGNKWRAKIKKNYKQINIGSFNTEEEAALAYNAKAKELFGEFAFLNVIQS